MQKKTPELNSYVDQAKLLRVFQLIRLLKGPPEYRIPQLSQLLDCNRSTIYRYLKLLEEVGYLVDQDAQGYYFIFEAEADERRPHFSAPEAELLRQALSGLAADNPLRESLRRKIYLTSDLIPLADELAEAQHGRAVEQLAAACHQRYRVWLRRYHSANSDTCRDRLVEPYGFSRNYALLNAVDVETGQVRTFKLARIGRVEPLPTQVSTFAPAGEFLDAFGLAGTQPILVELHLTERAYRLLWEEVPAARSLLLPTRTGMADNFAYQFRGEVASFLGIGRFVLGLPTEIRVLAPVEFREYLRERVVQAAW